METSIRIIGTIHSSLKNLDDCPLQEKENAPAATLILLPDYVAGIKDIRPGSEILLFTWLHQADRSVIACFPRRDYHAPPIGVFSTRSPDRPNPIGLHRTKVISVKKDTIEVEALEVLDQTPLIDIKPVLN
jgi:tRNA-Thr(GGU) m(6)t(6)A37 methyltransferase TsaA